LVFTRLYQSPIGTLEISADTAFVTSVMFREAIKRTAPHASETEETSAPLELCVEQLDEYFTERRRDFDLPLRQVGTDFQQRVWAELRHIPFGKTISYLELARRLGDPKVIRAAASANGHNHLTIIVPCHRVIGADGTLVGYGGDLWRKKWLLEHEKAIPKVEQYSLF
jgi:methylated-DNA-[protein]-cysteine S-methyltransferase